MCSYFNRLHIKNGHPAHRRGSIRTDARSVCCRTAFVFLTTLNHFLSLLPASGSCHLCFCHDPVHGRDGTSSIRGWI